MRKIFSLFAAILFAGSMMAEVGEVFYTLVPQKPSKGAVSDYTKTGDQTIDDMTWTIPGNWYGNGALRLGGKSIENVDRTITGQTAMGEAISQIVITHAGVTSDNLKLNSVKVTVASDADFSSDVETVTLVSSTDFTIAKNANGTITLTPANDFWAKDSYYKFDFNITNTNGSNYAWVLNKIEFYSYAGGGDPEPTTQTLYLKLSNDWAGYTKKYSAYYFKDNTDNGWSAFMTAVDGEENMYMTTIPAGYSKVIFVRNNAEAAAPGWDTGDYSIVWSKTTDLTIPEGKNLFTVTSGGTGSECNGTWSKYGEAPTPVDSMTVYMVNTLDWATVKAFVWPAEGAAYKEWSGEAMIKTADKALEKDVYKYTFPASYGNVIFNNGDKQTTDQAWTKAKPYFVPGAANGEGKYTGEWFASLEEIKPVVPAKFYVTGDSALIVDAGYDKAVAWHSDAIKSEKDTFELSLKGGQAYQLQVVVGEAWKGYNDLSKKAEGLKAGGEFGNDICFSLSKDGKVQVVYFVKDEQVTFELIGDFYVKPVVKKDLYLVPGVWAEAEAKIAAWIWGKELAGQWTAFFAGKDTLKAEINADADSIIFMRYNKTVESPLWSEDGNIVWGRMDADTIDYVGLTYTITDWKKGQWTPYVAPVYEHENGYYLMGSHNEWAIDDAYKFTLNETAEGGVEEYKLDVTLTVGQKIKPAYVENDKAKDWYPAEGGDFEVTADYAGAKTVYFRPVRNGEWGAFGGFIYIDANPSTGISNTAVEGKAVKTISNGMLIIEKAGVRYNVMGQIIR